MRVYKSEWKVWMEVRSREYSAENSMSEFMVKKAKYCINKSTLYPFVRSVVVGNIDPKFLQEVAEVFANESGIRFQKLLLFIF